MYMHLNMENIQLMNEEFNCLKGVEILRRFDNYNIKLISVSAATFKTMLNEKIEQNRRHFN